MLLFRKCGITYYPHLVQFFVYGIELNVTLVLPTISLTAKMYRNVKNDAEGKGQLEILVFLRAVIFEGDVRSTVTRLLY